MATVDQGGMSSVYGLLVIIVKDIREEKSTVGVATVDQGGMSSVYGLLVIIVKDIREKK